MRRPRGLRHNYNKGNAMQVQKFIVTIKSGEKDGCGNPIPRTTEGEVRRALLGGLDASSVTVEECGEDY